MSKIQPKNEIPEALPLQAWTTRLANDPSAPRGSPLNTVDVQARTVEVTFSTGATVRRSRWIGWDTQVPFDEVLLVSREAVNLDRLNAGAPALDSHSFWSTSSQFGVVENPRIEKGEGRARIRFVSKGIDEAADILFEKVSEGIVRNVSVGYSIDDVEVKSPSKPGEVEQRIITRWTPQEISFVTVNADAGAQVRSQEASARYPISVRGLTPLPADLAIAAAARMRMRQGAI